MQSFLIVFLGGGLGSICRYSITRLLQHLHFIFPFATFLANIFACLLLGALIGLNLKGELPDTTRLLWVTGFCGGFSTFSTFSAETIQLFQNGNYLYAFLNIGFSISICLFSIYMGIKLV